MMIFSCNFRSSKTAREALAFSTPLRHTIFEWLAWEHCYYNCCSVLLHPPSLQHFFPHQLTVETCRFLPKCAKSQDFIQTTVKLHTSNSVCCNGLLSLDFVIVTAELTFVLFIFIFTLGGPNSNSNSNKAYLPTPLETYYSQG